MIVGFSGYARCGKDSLAAVLVRDHGFVRVAFADALRDLAASADPMIDINWDTRQVSRLAAGVDTDGWETLKSDYPEVREFLQRLGVGARDVLGGDIWVRIAMDKAAAVKPLDVVITDCRFPNEAEAIKAAGGVVVRIQRPGTAPVNAHKSETALDDWPFDFTVHNDGSLADLEAMVPSILSKFGLLTKRPGVDDIVASIDALGITEKQEVARALAVRLAADLRVSA